jgi:type IV pilus assembly protein PilN
MIRINLLPVRQIKAEVGRRQELIIAGGSLGLIVALLLGLNLYQSYRLSGLEKQLTELRKEIEALNLKAQGVVELGKKVSDLRGKLNVIEELNKKKTGPVRVMESLSSATPSRLWLTQFKETGGALTIDGLAIDNQTIADFLKSLSGSLYFTGVDLVETTQIEQEGIPLKKFSVKANLSYQPPALPAPEKTGATPATTEVKQR